MPRSSSSDATTKRRKRGKPKIPESVRLTADRVVVSVPDDGERRSKSGLLIPATAGPSPKRAVWADVVMVGPDARTVKAGDSVLFLPHVGIEVEINGDEYLLLRERDVQAVSTENSKDGKEGGAHAPGQYL